MNVVVVVIVFVLFEVVVLPCFSSSSFESEFFPFFFKLHPSGRRLFHEAKMDLQSKAFVRMLYWIIENMDSKDLSGVIVQLGVFGGFCEKMRLSYGGQFIFILLRISFFLSFSFSSFLFFASSLLRFFSSFLLFFFSHVQVVDTSSTTWTRTSLD
jgi:hypothetical protein